MKYQRHVARAFVGTLLMGAGVVQGCFINTGTFASGNASNDGSKNQISADAKVTGQATVTASGQVDDKTTVATNTTTTVGVTAAGQVVTTSSSPSGQAPSATPTAPSTTSGSLSTVAPGTPSPGTDTSQSTPTPSPAPTATAHTSNPTNVWAGQFAVTTIAGNGVQGRLDAEGTQAEFNQPRAIAANGSTNLYVTDEAIGDIRKVNLTSSAPTVTLFAGVGLGYSDGNVFAALFGGPSAITTDAAGSLYVADTLNNVIRKIVPGTSNNQSIVTTIAGTQGVAGTTDGAAASSSFNGPTGIAVSSSGDVYVADTGNQRIRRIAGGLVSTIAGSSAGYQDGNGGTAEFNNPGAMVLDASGKLDICDSGNNRIRQLDVTSSSHVVTTLAGSTQGFADGPLASARFNNPTSVALYSDGSVIVLDAGNLRIRAITPAGTVVTVAGDGAAGTTDGPAASASINAPGGLAVDSSGVIYLTDTNGAILRAITPLK